MEAFHSNAASERETMVNKLYEASVRGNVQALDVLMEKDELILDRVSLTCFDETPAHIAVMRGHVDFTRALLSRKPKLASHLDSLGRSPLHMACAEGHVDVVRELLGADDGVCWVHDGDGRTPLHLAAAKGQVEVLREVIGVISRRVESTQERVQVLQGGGGEGESILHVCVKYNRLKALKLVVEWMRSIDDDEHDSIINSKDRDGNTILHLAAALKQKETIQYLFQIPGVIATQNTKNENGFTALDVLEVYPVKDLKSMEIRDILLLAGVRRAHGGLGRTTADNHLESPPTLPTPTTTTTTTTTIAKIISKAKLLISNTWKKFFKMDGKWLEEARGNLIMSASVIAAMAFQGALSPPGGVWQDYNNGTTTINDTNVYPGTSIAGSYWITDFSYFSIFNTLSLMASLSTILLATSGIPLKNRLAVWLLMTNMCTFVGSMALAYLYAMILVAPHSNDFAFYRRVNYIWLGICGFVLLIHSIRFFVWLFERRPTCFRKRSVAKLVKYENLDRV